MLQEKGQKCGLRRRLLFCPLQKTGARVRIGILEPELETLLSKGLRLREYIQLRYARKQGTVIRHHGGELGQRGAPAGPVVGLGVRFIVSSLWPFVSARISSFTGMGMESPSTSSMRGEASNASDSFSVSRRGRRKLTADTLGIKADHQRRRNVHLLFVVGEANGLFHPKTS